MWETLHLALLQGDSSTSRLCHLARRRHRPAMLMASSYPLRENFRVAPGSPPRAHAGRPPDPGMRDWVADARHASFRVDASTTSSAYPSSLEKLCECEPMRQRREPAPFPPPSKPETTDGSIRRGVLAAANETPGSFIEQPSVAPLRPKRSANFFWLTRPPKKCSSRPQCTLPPLS
jgi:hypothetical protein